MFAKWGVDEDEFCFAMLHYNLMEDPELVEMTQNRMTNIDKHAAKSTGAGGKGGKK